MGSLIEILNSILERALCSDNPDLLSLIEEVLQENITEKIKVIVFNVKKRAFHTVKGNPVFTSEDFLELFEKLAHLAKPFIVGGNRYYPLVVKDTVAGCVITPQEISADDSMLMEKIIGLYNVFATNGVNVTSGRDSQEMLFNNRNVIFGEIAGGVLHDLNNIIGAILGRAQLAKFKYNKKKEPEVLFDSLDTIEKISLTGGKITHRLKNFARMSEALTPKYVSIKESFDSAMNMIEHKLVDFRENKGIDFRVDNLIAHDVEIRTDPVLLEEVMFNLIDASMLLLNQGGHIEVSGRRDPYNATVTITPYGKTASISTIHPEIMVVKNLLSIQGGVLKTNDNGVFEVTIPQSMSKSEGEKDEITIEFNGLSADEEVLLIEDNEGMRKVLEEILEGLGCTVKSASTAGEGLKLFASGSFDAVFTDLGLPDLDGKEVASRIKNTDPDIRIAAITGWQDRLDPVFDATITKPFNIDEIHSFLARDDEKTIVFFRKDVS